MSRDWDSELRANEYPAPAGNGFLYVAGYAIKSSDELWAGSTFQDNTLIEIEPSPSLGIIVSARGFSSKNIEHSPDILYPLCALNLIPARLNKVLCVDRRGGTDAAPHWLKRLFDGGASLIFDGEEDSPLEAIIPVSWFSNHQEWSPRYSHKVLFTGPIDALERDAWACCHESYAANECRHILELLRNGTTARSALESPSRNELVEAVSKLGRNLVTAPEKLVPWAETGMNALMQRDDINKLNAGRGSDILAVAKIWNAQLERRPFRPHEPSRVAKIWGVDAMISAYLDGVPIEDVIA